MTVPAQLLVLGGGAIGPMGWPTSQSVPLIGPELTHFDSRGSFAGSTLEHENPGDLALWLADPPEWKPGSFMPNLNLTPEQIEALEAYLRSLD